MTTRIYLRAVSVLDSPPQSGDIPAERLFIDASSLGEIWIDTEHLTKFEPGKSITVSFLRPLGIGFERLQGTIERAIPR